jgi:molybdopterin-containing oxidoreductase family iron-sulfur binding subunit
MTTEGHELRVIGQDPHSCGEVKAVPLAICSRCAGPVGIEAHLLEVENVLRRAGFADVRHVRLCENCKVGGTTEQLTTGLAAPPPAADSRAEGVAASRRVFMTRLAAVAGVAGVAAVGAATGGAAPSVAPKRRWGMVIDTRRCVGCRACVVACKAENKTPPGVNYMVVTNNMLGERPDDKPVFSAKPCFHCEKPPCVNVCPVSATFKRDQDGIVVVDYDRCIGCRYCQTACPYGARHFDFGENYQGQTADGAYGPPSPEYNQFRTRDHGASPIGNVRKCMFCLHLQDENGNYDKAAGRWPSCAKTCTGHAIHFGDFNDPDSEVSRLIRERQPLRVKEELGTEPNVVYLL